MYKEVKYKVTLNVVQTLGIMKRIDMKHKSRFNVLNMTQGQRQDI
jgi:hypothetical protein